MVPSGSVATDARQELRRRIFPDASDGSFLLFALGKKQRNSAAFFFPPRNKRKPVLRKGGAALLS
jgi:hypothetical protein